MLHYPVVIWLLCIIHTCVSIVHFLMDSYLIDLWRLIVHFLYLTVSSSEELLMESNGRSIDELFWSNLCPYSALSSDSTACDPSFNIDILERDPTSSWWAIMASALLLHCQGPTSPKPVGVMDRQCLDGFISDRCCTTPLSFDSCVLYTLVYRSSISWWIHIW